jgi:hypothetical protein
LIDAFLSEEGACKKSEAGIAVLKTQTQIHERLYKNSGDEYPSPN